MSLPNTRSLPNTTQGVDKVIFGGLEGASGNYCLPPRDLESLPDLLRSFQPRGIPRILKAGLDPLALSQAGWGVVWSSDIPDAVRDALTPLLARRQEQTGPLFRELEYLPDESLYDFLERFDTGPDSVNPRKVPYYLLFVGSPDALGFGLQTELAVSRAVGRLAFESADGYADYVERLVAYERRWMPSPRSMTFFGVENPDDPLTTSAVENLVRPLKRKIAARRPDWSLKRHLRGDANRDRLKQLLRGERRPSILFTASHAVRYRLGSPRQATHQGALVCADWPGPRRWQGEPMPDRFLLTASDVPPSADLSGLIALLFACYSAGTPRVDSYSCEDKALAPAPFVSPLPRALLRRGALAVIGHVDLALEQSFLWYNAGPQLEAFDSVLYELMAGHPIGFALRHLSQRYAQLAVHAANAARKACGSNDASASLRDFQLWAAYEDARNYVLLGDPAARLHA